MHGIPRRAPSGPTLELVTAPAQYANGNSNAAIALDWNRGPSQTVTLNSPTPVIDLVTSLPRGESARMTLRVQQDGTGNRVPTFTPHVYTAGGTPLVFSTAPSAYDLVDLYWDGQLLSMNFFAQNLQ